jgi:hypothetical protein
VSEASVPAGSFGAAAMADAPVPSSVPKAIVARSAYDSIHSVLARRHEHAAAIVRGNPDVVAALKTVARWVIAFCTDHGLDASQVVVTGRMSPEGAIVLHITERGI